MKKYRLINLIIAVTLFITIVAVVLNAKIKEKFKYKPLTVEQTIRGFETRSSQTMLDALAMAKFAGKMEEAKKCPCSEIEISEKFGRVQVEISYDECYKEKIK